MDPVSSAPALADAAGEICIAGANVSPGYWNNDPGLIGFGDDQFVHEGDRFFRTGDLGTMTNDGLRITGRLKDVIIRAGQNIIPDDIEAGVELSTRTVAAGPRPSASTPPTARAWSSSLK